MFEGSLKLDGGHFKDVQSEPLLTMLRTIYVNLDYQQDFGAMS